jgi:hypothetical protein
VRLNPHNLTLTHDLSWTDDMVSLYGHNEPHVAMLRNCRIGLEKDAAETYVVADGTKLGNGVSEIKLYFDRIAQAKSTIPALLGHSNVLGLVRVYAATVRDLEQVHQRPLLRRIRSGCAWPLGLIGSVRRQVTHTHQTYNVKHLYGVL